MIHQERRDLERPEIQWLAVLEVRDIGQGLRRRDEHRRGFQYPVGSRTQ